MKQEKRRQGIIKKLSESDNPVSAGALSSEFGVSRQIIVKDIANLRAEGKNIISCSRGYIYENKRPSRIFKIIHSDEDVGKELLLIVSMGGVIEDVFICHKLYDRISAKLKIKTAKDVERFLENIASGKSKLLKNVTSGYHYHTISAESDDILEAIGEKLGEEGFLAPLTEFEPEELKGEKNYENS